MTFIVFPAGEYEIGSLKDEPDRQNDEIRHAVKITRPFALLDREVTFAELIAFDPQYSGVHAACITPNRKLRDLVQCGTTRSNFATGCRSSGVTPKRMQSYPAAESLDKDTYPRESNQGSQLGSAELANTTGWAGVSSPDGGRVGGGLPSRNTHHVRSGWGRWPAGPLRLESGTTAEDTCMFRKRVGRDCVDCTTCMGICLNGATIGTVTIHE